MLLQLFQKKSYKYYFAERDPDETNCENITRLNFLPSQFHAALAGSKQLGGLSPPKFSFGGLGVC